MNGILCLPYDCIKTIFGFVESRDAYVLTLTSKIIQDILKETNLSLNYSKINMSYEFFKYFANMRTIEINDTKITDEGLKYLKGNNNSLKKISLENCQYITDNGLKYLRDISLDKIN